MKNLLIAGSGKIGSVLAHFLAASKDYHVYLVDVDFPPAIQNFSKSEEQHLTLLNLDVTNKNELERAIKTNYIDAIVSCLPYFLNSAIAETAATTHIYYFDLTEDVATAKHIDQLAEKNPNIAFVPQCGLAPGFVNIVAADLIHKFDQVEIVKLRCGGLPQTTSHALQYALTWSIDGLINEYANPCDALSQGKKVQLEPLSDLESIQVDGQHYEAFNTSGGVSSLPETYQDKIHTLNYKTIRYPGHCEKMRFLMYDLNLVSQRETLKKILLHSVPYTHEDVVVVYVSANGKINQQLTREAYIKKFYPQNLWGLTCTAIQATTASSACAVIDMVLNKPENYKGRIKQEDFKLKDFLENKFAQWMQN